MNASSPDIAKFERLNRWRNGGLSFLPGLEGAFRRAFARVRDDLPGPVDVRLGDFTVLAAPRDPVVSERLILRRRYEKRQTRLVRSLLRPGSVFCDVGANIGYYSLLAASIVGDEGRVLAFEPDPDHADLIERSAQLNRFSRISVHPLALAAEKGRATLHRNASNAGNQSLLAENVSDRGEAIEVEVSTLDGELAKVLGDRPVDLLKIDTEGAEGLVLSGAERTLSTPGLEILLEFWPEGIERFGGDPAALLTQLSDAGFTFAELARDGSTPAIDREEALSLPAGQDQIDLYLRRPS